MKSLKESILDKDFDLKFVEKKIVNALKKYTSVVPSKFASAPTNGPGPYRMLTSFESLKKILDDIGIKYTVVTKAGGMYSSDLVLDIGVEFTALNPYDKRIHKDNKYLVLRRMGGLLPFDWGCLELETRDYRLAMGHPIGFETINDSDKLNIDWNKPRSDEDRRKVYQCGMNRDNCEKLTNTLAIIYRAQNEKS